MGGGDTDLPGCTGQGTVTYLQISLFVVPLFSANYVTGR